MMLKLLNMSIIIDKHLIVTSKPVRYVASVKENGDSYMGDDPFMTALTEALGQIRRVIASKLDDNLSYKKCDDC